MAITKPPGSLMSRAPSNEDDSTFSIYFYHPSSALAIIFTALYALQAMYHFYLSIWLPCIRKQVSVKHRYTIPYYVAAAISTIGHGVRIASVSDPGDVTKYALSSGYIVIAPIFVCATLYWLVSRLIATHSIEQREEEGGGGGGGRFCLLKRVRPRVLGTAFVASDVISFMTQGAGSGIASANNWTGTIEKIGTAVLITGLALQFATFSVYLVVLGTFCQRVGGQRRSRHGTAEKGGGISTAFLPGFSTPVKRVVLGMWMGSVFVWIRSLYRLVEFGLGVNGYPFTHEWMLWVFEATPMWIALAVLGWFHPVKWLQPEKSSASSSTTARQVV